MAPWKRVSTIAAMAVVAAFQLSFPAAALAQATVHVTVVDKKGNPVTDLQAAEFEVKIGGKRLEVMSAGPAQAPMRIALLVSDAGTGGFQAGSRISCRNCRDAPNCLSSQCSCNRKLWSTTHPTSAS